MASFNGNIGTPSGGFNLKVEYSISQSVSGNYSDVTATGYAKRNNSSYYPYNSTSSASLNIGGNSASASPSYNLGSDGYKTIMSHSARIYHNSDGTKSITISFSFNGKLSSYYPNGSISQTITLPTIPRTSEISVSGSSFNIGEEITINLTKHSSSFTDKVKISFGETKTSEQYARYLSEDASTPLIWDTQEDATELYKKIPKTNSGICQLSVETYNEDTLIGTNTISFLMLLTDANPIFNDFNFADINPITVRLLEGEEATTSQKVILGYSNVQVTIPAENKAVAQKEATMSLYRFNNNEQPYSDTDGVSITSNGVTSGEFTVYAIDSRTNAKPVTKSATSVINYTPLQKGNITAKRENGVSEAVVLQFDAKIDLVNFGAKINSVTSAQYRYKVASETEWSELENITVQVDENGEVTFNDLIKGDQGALGFDVENAYNIEVYLKDELSEVKYIANFGAGIPHIAYAKNGVGIMGKYDESVGGLLQVGGQRIDNMAGGGDTLPIGTIVDYDGDTAPVGYEEVADYSTEEVEIGTWIDGKPLYRKVGNITFTSAYNGTGSHKRGSFISSDIKYVTISKVFNTVNGNANLYNGYNSTITSNIYVENASSSADKGYIMGFTNRSTFLNIPFYVVVEYTKTTD